MDAYQAGVIAPSAFASGVSDAVSSLGTWAKPPDVGHRRYSKFVSVVQVALAGDVKVTLELAGKLALRTADPALVLADSG
jgi:hypothetical protein